MSPQQNADSTRRRGVWMRGTHVGQMPSTVTGIAVDPHGDSIACATAGGTVHLLDATLTEVWSGRHVRRWRKAVPLYSVSISRRAGLVCTGGDDGTAMLWTLSDGQVAARLGHEHRVPVLSSAFSPDGRALALGYRAGGVVLRELSDHRESGRLQHSIWASQVEYDTTGTRIASAGFDKTVRGWQLKDLSETWRVTTPGLAGAMSVAPEADRLVVNGFGSCAVVLSMDDGRELAALQHDNEVISARFSADGRLIVTGCRGGVVAVWGADSLEKQSERAFERTVVEPHVLPSGDALVFGCGDEVRVVSLTGDEKT